MIRHPKACRGFTLIELMVTLTIAAILLMVAVPSMLAYKRNAELTSATNTLVGAINAARGEAMKRGMYAMVVPTNNGSDWATGWVVFVDKNRTQAYDGSVDSTVLVQGAMPSYFTVTGNNSATGTTPYIMFDASGYSRTKGGGFGALTLTLTRNDISGSELFNQTRRITIAATGRLRSCRPVSATDANCLATATS